MEKKKAKKEKEKATASDKQSPIVWERISFKAGLGYLKSEIQYMIPFFLLAYLMAHPVLVWSSILFWVCFFSYSSC